MKKLSLLFTLCMVSMLAFAQSDSPAYPAGGGITQQGLSQDSDNNLPPCAEGIVTLTPHSYDFGNVPRDFAVLANFTLCNERPGPITIYSMMASPDPPYRISSTNCPSILGSAQSCTITVQFLTSSLGLQPGTLKVYDSAPSSPQTSDLSGTGIPDVSLTPSPCNFGDRDFCTVTVTNYEPITLHISAVQTEGNFRVSINRCNTTLPAHQSCYVVVEFIPTGPGNDGYLTVTDDARDSMYQQDQLIGPGGPPLKGN